MNESIIKINGTLYKSMLLNAAASLNANIDIVNDLNVFPIPDGDTGENMFLTLKGGIDAIKNLEDEDISIIASKAGQGMLLGARGNSGVILSQLFYGISLGLQNIKEASLNDFVKKFNEADKNNELIIDLASGVPSPMKAEAMPEAGLAGMLQGSPYKQKKAFDFIIDGDKEITLHVDK